MWVIEFNTMWLVGWMKELQRMFRTRYPATSQGDRPEDITNWWKL